MDGEKSSVFHPEHIGASKKVKVSTMFVYTLYLLHKKSSVDSDVMYKNQGASFGSNTFYKIVQLKKLQQ